MPCDDDTVLKMGTRANNFSPFNKRYLQTSDLSTRSYLLFTMFVLLAADRIEGAEHRQARTDLENSTRSTARSDSSRSSSEHRKAEAGGKTGPRSGTI